MGEKLAQVTPGGTVDYIRPQQWLQQHRTGARPPAPPVPLEPRTRTTRRTGRNACTGHARTQDLPY